jgi:DNA-binding NtrC family response regulator
MHPVTVLIVDDERPLRASLRRLLAPEGFQILEAADGREAMVMVARSAGAAPPEEGASTGLVSTEVPPIDIIVSDLRMPEASGLELLRFVRQTAPQIEMLLLTAFGQVGDAVAALKLGAFNFLEKPFEPEALLLEVKRAQLLVLERRAKVPGKPLPREKLGIVGDSAPIRNLRNIVSRVGPSEATVLILGESGTGKELVAQAIHEASRRTGGPFVAVHCGAIPESLIESELFGHVKGAFTGAVATREGRFAQAEGGTIFLDEIGEMPLAMQVKLLRVLQERTYEAVGSSKPRRGDFRVIAATNRDLTKAVAAGTFRQDLFYRLNVVPVEVPALRERPGDLELLCEAFVEVQNRSRTSMLLPPDPACFEILRRYSWPGNVRELEHLIERIAVLKGEGAITESDLPAVIRETVAIGLPMAVSSAPRNAARSMNLNGELNRLEVELIRMALQQSGGNKNKASQILGLNRTTLIEKIKRLGLQGYADGVTEGTPRPASD